MEIKEQYQENKTKHLKTYLAQVTGPPPDPFKSKLLKEREPHLSCPYTVIISTSITKQEFNQYFLMCLT